MEKRFTYEMPSPTANALVGRSHRGSRVGFHAAAANRKIRRREASQCGQPYGGSMGVFAVAEMKDGAGSVHYVLKDHLGSWTTITDANGNIEQEVSFDAWGNPRDAETWSGSYNGALMFDRGFTGHEHLNSFGLINMNGRMYDPIMSSFLSVDNYVQAPDFSQSFNRYAYCLNNPLRYVDPDGEWFLTGGVGFGKREDGTYGLTSVSLGVNFGCFGFGVNLGVDSNGISSVGVYGELGPHIGCAGANLTLSVGYDFRHSTMTGSLSANYGISLGGSCNLGVGVSGSATHSLSSGDTHFGWGANLGIGLKGDIWGAGLGVSYSRCNGQNSFGLGLSAYKEMPQAVYDFGVKDNPQSKEGYCVPGALEENSRVLGCDWANADYWASQRPTFYIIEINGIAIPIVLPIYKSPTKVNEIVAMINGTNWAESEMIPPSPEALINAYNSKQKVIASVNYQNNDNTYGHTVNVRMIEKYSNTYRIYLAETSRVRHVPTYITPNVMKSYGFCTFRLRP